MKNLTGKILACTLAAILLGGCGFQLRGSKGSVDNIEALTVTSGQQYGKLARALEAEMRAQHISDTGEHAWNLVILDQRIKQNVLAYNDSANAALIEIELVVQFTVTNEKGETVIAPNSERVVRPYEPDNNRALATDRETKLMLNETYDEMAAALLRRIDFIAGQKQTPAP
jgi:LPS-assembly lipoprotein